MKYLTMNLIDGKYIFEHSRLNFGIFAAIWFVMWCLLISCQID